MPTLRALLLAVWQRLKFYIWRVGRVITTATVLIYALSSFALTPSGVSTTTDSGELLRGRLGKVITPVFTPTGIKQENWPATEPDYLHSDIPRQLRDSVATIPANAAALAAGITDPLGFGNLSRSDQTARFSGANQATLRALATHFTPASAVAYLIFILLYIPCISTMGAIRRETGSWRWTIYALVWGDGVVNGLATTWYQIATFALHPLDSSAWVLGITGALIVVVRTMRMVGARREGVFLSRQWSVQ